MWNHTIIIVHKIFIRVARPNWLSEFTWLETRNFVTNPGYFAHSFSNMAELECHRITVSSMAHKKRPYRVASFSVHDVTEYVMSMKICKKWSWIGVSRVSCHFMAIKFQIETYAIIAQQRWKIGRFQCVNGVNEFRTVNCIECGKCASEIWNEIRFRLEDRQSPASTSLVRTWETGTVAKTVWWLRFSLTLLTATKTIGPSRCSVDAWFCQRALVAFSARPAAFPWVRGIAPVPFDLSMHSENGRSAWLRC